MKQSRRHELKTNELSIWLQQTYAAITRNFNYVIGGVVVVVLILVIAIMVRNRRHDAREQAWSNYYQMLGQSVREKPEDVMKQVRAFADEHRDDGDLGPLAAMLLADKALEQSLLLDPLKEADKHLAALKEARAAYTEVIDRYAAKRPPFAVQARLGLAKVLESLATVGEAGVEDVRKQYQSVIDSPEKGPCQAAAKDALAALDARLKPIQLIATRPAGFSATAPASRMAVPPATQTAPEPGTSSPAEPSTAPAVPPAEQPVEPPPATSPAPPAS